MARPKIVWSEAQYKIFQGLCKIQCTLEEICDVMDVSEKTLYRLCREHYSLDYSKVYKKYSATGKSSLRRLQFTSAENGNVTMQIWLGKQWLGQSDKIEQKTETTVTEGNQVIAYVPDDGRENGSD